MLNVQHFLTSEKHICTLFFTQFRQANEFVTSSSSLFIIYLLIFSFQLKIRLKKIYIMKYNAALPQVTTGGKLSVQNRIT